MNSTGDRLSPWGVPIVVLNVAQLTFASRGPGLCLLTIGRSYVVQSHPVMFPGSALICHV